MNQLERQTMWSAFSDEFEKIATPGGGAQRFAVGSGLGALVGGTVGYKRGEGETATDAMRRGMLRGMAVGGLGAYLGPKIKDYPKGYAHSIKHIGENAGAYKALGGVAAGGVAALAAKKAIENKVRQDIQEGH